ncbi:elongation factor EF-2 [Thermoplasmatales archaeon SW_10_69_26]|nr:MAG: elongation factor EF-2 [Thermoplasmatales archaeon SW_10_69_26]
MGRKEENIKRARDIMDNPEFIRNIGTAAHIDHGKTTFSDNLIAGAGMMSEELAGEQLVMDFDEQEQERGITIDSAALSMVHEYEEDDYLINLFDTPGHVDFGGDVTRAMRAIDGAVVVVDAVESVMPQTETVIRQALREKGKPILFINKVDRLINEVKIGPDEMQQKFFKIIREVNELIRKYAPNDELAEEWQVSPDDGTVAFGSALYNWAVSIPWIQQTGYSMEHVYNRLENDEVRELIKECPLADVMLNIVVKHMPPPDEAQKYRIPHIWRGDPESEYGQSLVNCDEQGPLSFMVTKIVMDEHAGEVAVGRMFSGQIERGQQVYISGVAGEHRIQDVGVMVGADRVNVDSVDAGNLAAVVGLDEAIAGSTVTEEKEVEPFERIVHVSEPVVTVSVEAKNVAELPKLVKALRSVSKADPSIQVSIDQETGENLMSGMGELHLEVTEHRIKEEHGIEIQTSEPIVVYRESISEATPEFEGRSPNRHNRLFFEVEPLEPEVMEAIREGELPDGKIRDQDEKEVREVLTELGWERDDARSVSWIEGTNMFIDDTKGVQYLYETMDLVMEGFQEAMDGGPRADEPCMGLKVRLKDAKLHEDAIHRGPSQTIPAVRNAIFGAMTAVGVDLLEPRQKVYVNVPQDIMGDVTRELQQRRSTIAEIESEGESVVVNAEAPVDEMFGFSAAIRSATGGRALWSTEQAGFAPVPANLLDEITTEIRERKGMKPDVPTPVDFQV